MGIVATMVARVAAGGEIEAVYRQDGDRLWRALYAFAGNADVASDAVAQIAFVRDGASTPNELYLMKADGTGVTRLTDAPGEDIDPVFSPAS